MAEPQDAAAEEARRERRRLYENRRQVLFGQVLLGMGLAEEGTVFPKGVPAGLPPAPKFSEVHSIAVEPQRGFLTAAWGLLAGFAAPQPTQQRPQGTPVITPTGKPSALGPMPTSVPTDGPPPPVDFRGMREDTIRSVKKVIDPIDGTIKRLRALAIDREETLEIGDIPCSPQRNEVLECYHRAHGVALGRFEAEGLSPEDWPTFRTSEVLGCESAVRNFLQCAGEARATFVASASS